MKRCLFLLTLLNLLTGLHAQSPDPPVSLPSVGGAPGSVDYLRCLKTGTDEVDRLQTAVVRFEKGDTIVDLVGVVHLGDSAYYEKLNESLKGYDVVLYEMVGGGAQLQTDAAVSAETPDEMAGVRGLQQLAKSFLGLEFQTDGIDYRAPNFVHADVEWDEFNDLMAARNQSFTTLFTRAMALAGDGEVAGIPSDEGENAALMKRLFSALMAGNSGELKRVIAPLISEAETFVTQLEGDDGTVLISERNRVVMEKLAGVREGRGGGKYAIFYGAGHMPDFEKRLMTDGYRKGTTVWVDAWLIPDTAVVAADGALPPAASPSDFLLKLMENNPEIMSTIQQLGTILETLKSTGE